MANYKINCEVNSISGDRFVCPGAARARLGNTFTIGIVTPAGMCARSFAAVFPVAMAMLCSDSTPWERGKDYVDVTCPDGHTVYRLARTKSEFEKANDSKEQNG